MRSSASWLIMVSLGIPHAFRHGLMLYIIWYWSKDDTAQSHMHIR